MPEGGGGSVSNVGSHVCSLVTRVRSTSDRGGSGLLRVAPVKLEKQFR